jgi:hypothetical protein
LTFNSTSTKLFKVIVNLDNSPILSTIPILTMKIFSIYTYLFLSYLLIVLPNVQASDLPNLHTATDATAEITSDFSGGISVNQDPYQQQVTQYLCDEVTVAGEMMVDPTHVGQTADIFVWAEATLPPDETLYYFMLDERLKAILSWDQVPAHLAAFIPQVTLKSVESVTMYQGQFIYPGTLKVFFGYRLSDNTVVFNGQPIDITINPGCGNVSGVYASNPSPNSTLTFETTTVHTGFQVITIENTGEGTLQLDGLSLSNSTDFQVTPTDLSMSLAKGEKGNFIVQCSYFGESPHTAELALNSNDPKQSKLTYHLECHGPASPPPASTELPQHLTAISAATADTEYTSNTLVVSGVTETVTATVTGGNATLVKNGIETGAATTTVSNGDTLAVTTRSATGAGNTVNLALQLGEKILPWSLTTAAVESLSPVSGKMSGYTPVNCEVSESGGAVCQLPLTAPAGTSGMAPKLSLGYNSQGNNGPLGVGWSLNGLSAITRCRAIQAQNGIDLRVECHNCLLNPTSLFKS